MGKFLIKLLYETSIVVDVEAETEAEALTKAREVADNADEKEFSITKEIGSEVIMKPKL